MSDNLLSTPWPEFSYPDFKSTGHLLHMGMQAIGKLKLYTPFEPHWANVPLWLTSRGLTTGIIPYEKGAFSIDLDLISHKVICHSSLGLQAEFDLTSMSVADFIQHLFHALQKIHVDVSVNFMPQEIPNPIPLDEDSEKRTYDRKLATAFWRILLSTHQVLLRYHARFDGETPPIGFMWGTFDLRDARYNGKTIPTTGINSGYIRRNAMNEGQVEAGWWPGNSEYPQAAFYSFTYPEPQGIHNAKIKPEAALWNPKLQQFILNYADLQSSKTPDADLLSFYETAYQAGTKLAEGWEGIRITKGEPETSSV